MRLLREGIEALLEQNYTSMLVWVLKQNHSRLFYESLQPNKAGEEIDKIGGQEYVELAYVWNDLKSLKQIVVGKLI